MFHFILVQLKKMKWWFLILGIALLQMSVFIEVTEAKARDSDGDGTPDIGRQTCNFIY